MSVDAVGTSGTTNTNTSSSTKTYSRDYTDATASYTDRGTRIVKSSNEMNQDMFMKILVAQLSNQDPTQNQDTTAYVSQLAQFASIEQLSNLNTMMQLSAAQGLTGKYVAFNTVDTEGVQDSGLVQSVFKKNGSIYLEVMNSKGTLKDFLYDNVTNIMDMVDTTSDNNAFLNATALMGKKVEMVGDKTDERITGTVTSVFRDSEGIKLTVKQENGTEKTFYLGSLLKVE